MPKPVQNDELVSKNSAASKKDQRKAQKRLDKTNPKKSGDVVYAEFSGSLKSGDDALTGDEAKKLLGWTVQPKEDGETLTFDGASKPVKCVNNSNNRPFNSSWADTLAQEILRGRWRANGETIIIGQRGAVLSGQHRLIALIRAVELWKADRDKYPFWKTEPTIDTVLSTGVEEDDVVVNTIDTGKTRSLSDVIYRSDYFGTVSNSDRKGLAKVAESAVRFFWDRTGVADAYDISRTHAEALDMLNRHPKLVTFVKHIYQENAANKIGKLIPVGTAAALCYFMAVSKTEPKAYYEADVREEESLDFSEEDTATGFWAELAKDKSKLGVVRDVLAEMYDQSGDAGVSFSERLALVIKAWHAGDSVKAATLKLEYHKDEDGIKHLAEFPLVGGIDRGVDGDDQVILGDEDEEEDEEDGDEDDGEETPKKPAAKGKASAKRMPKDGDEVWVLPSKKSEEPWFGTLISTKQSPGGKTIAKVRFQSNQKQYDVDYDSLSFEKPGEE